MLHLKPFLVRSWVKVTEWIMPFRKQLNLVSVRFSSWPVNVAKCVWNTTAIKKLDHWQAVAIAACEQCGLNLVPEVLAPISLHEWLNSSDLPTSKFVLAPEKNKRCIGRDTTWTSPLNWSRGWFKWKWNYASQSSWIYELVYWGPCITYWNCTCCSIIYFKLSVLSI